MHLSEHSLRQLDRAYLDALDEAALRALSARLLDDLKEARGPVEPGTGEQFAPAEQSGTLGTGRIPRTD
jgi:hypothetical protein